MEHVAAAAQGGRTSGDGPFTRQCEAFIEARYNLSRALLTTSCTDALELSALLLDIQPGDEVILPSFAFVSCANAFALRGATLRFADIDPERLTLFPEEVERLRTPQTKAVVMMHYAGVACDMNWIAQMSTGRGIALIEDAALGLDASYKGMPLGTFGDLSTLSFHETKTISSGEGGALLVNDPNLIERATWMRDKGTNRAEVIRGEADKYTWRELGSSFLPADLLAAFLWGQLEEIDRIQALRHERWNRYQEAFTDLATQEKVKLPFVPLDCTHNASVYYLRCRDEGEREALRNHLWHKGILAVFHYLPLHLSPFHLRNNPAVSLPVTEAVSSTILRLPLFPGLTETEQQEVIDAVVDFFRSR